MENSDLNPDTEEKKTPRRKNTGEFLALWLRGRHPELSKSSDSEEDEDDNDIDTDKESTPRKSSNRLQRLAKGLFKGLVVKEAVQPKPESLLERLRANADGQPTGSGTGGAPGSTPSSSHESDNSLESSDLPLQSGSEAELGLRTAETGDGAGDVETEDHAEETDHETDQKDDPEADRPDESISPETPQPESAESTDEDDEPDSPVTPHSRPAAGGSGTAATGSSGGGSGSGSRGGGRSAGSSPGGSSSTSGGSGSTFGPPIPVILAPPAAERVIIERETVIERETIRERGNNRLAAVALLATGAEYIGRRRADSKIRKEFVKNREVEAKKHRDGQAKLEQLARKSQDQLKEVLAREQKYEMQIPEKPTTQVEKQSTHTERAATTREIIAEKYTNKTNQTELNPGQRLTSETNTTAMWQNNPENQLPQAINSPDNESSQSSELIENKPTELIYERSHEIKDDKFSFIGGGAASPTHSDSATISRNDPTMAQMQALSNSISNQLPDKSSKKASNTDSTGIYTKAALGGIGAAAVIILFAILAYIAIG